MARHEMRPGDVVVSRHHKGLILLVIVYKNGSSIGRKLKHDGTVGRQEVCLGSGDIAAVRKPLPGCDA